MSTLYADGFSDISIINDVVRIDLFRLQPDRSGTGAAVKQVHEGTLAIPLRGLVAGLELLDRVRHDLAARETAPATAGETTPKTTRETTPTTGLAAAGPASEPVASAVTALPTIRQAGVSTVSHPEDPGRSVNFP